MSHLTVKIVNKLGAICFIFEVKTNWKEEQGAICTEEPKSNSLRY